MQDTTAEIVRQLEEALISAELAGRCLEEIRHPERALVSAPVLIERAERCLGEVVGTLRQLRARLAEATG